MSAVRGLLAAVLLAALPVAARAELEPPPLLPLGYGYESAAANGSPATLVFNPAAIGVRYPQELAFTMMQLRDGHAVYRGALAASRFTLGMSGAEKSRSSFSLGVANGGERMRVGAVLQMTPRDGGGRLRDVRVGALSRPSPWLSLGGVLDHAFAPTFDGSRLDREWTAGVGIRPFALSRSSASDHGPKLTLTADWALTEGEPFESSRWRGGVEIEVVPGLGLQGLYLSESKGVQVGLTLLGVRTALHGQAGFADDHGPARYSTASVSVHEGEDRTVLGMGTQRRVASVAVRGELGDDALSGFSFLGSTHARPVAPIHRQLERAREDPLTRGVLLELGGAVNMAQLEELAPKIERLRRAGKPVVAYLESGGGRGDLFLASACDAIVASPEALFMGLGLRVERRYYRKLLADWGVRIDRSSYGKYKSAYRNYSTDSTTAADREVIESSLDESQELFVTAVAAGRRIPRERLLTALDGRRWRSADLAKLGVIDSVGYREDAARILGRLAQLGAKPRRVKLAATPEITREWTRRSPIAVVYAAGGIETGTSGNDLLFGPYMGSETVSRQIERAFKNPEVRVVVLRVESPGGSSLGSDLIYHALSRVKNETGKPLIASMGGAAASGGYHISLPADRIYADRFTRTGSIGVVFARSSFEQWYRKHDVRQDVFERGPFMRGVSEGEDWDRQIQASADSAVQLEYREFVDLVARERGMSWEKTHEVAQGRVWYGEDARERNLIDEIGGLDAALAEARKRAGVPEREKIRLLEFRRPRPGLVDRLVGSLVREAWEHTLRIPADGAALRWMDEDVDP